MSSETWISFLHIPKNAIPQEMFEILLSPALCHVLAPHKKTCIWPWCCRHLSTCLKMFSKPVELVMQLTPLSTGYLFKMTTTAGTLQFQQLHGSSVEAVPLEWPSIYVCFFLVSCSRARLPNFLSFIPLLWVFVALGLTQMSMLHCREDAVLCNSFIAWLYFSCHGPVCLLHDSGLSNNHWENHALADKTKEMKNEKKKGLWQSSFYCMH